MLGNSLYRQFLEIADTIEVRSVRGYDAQGVGGQKSAPVQGPDFEFETRTVNAIGSEQSVEQIANADVRKGAGLDGIFFNSNQNCFTDINSNRWMAAAVITRSQAKQAIGRAESDGMEKG